MMGKVSYSVESFKRSLEASFIDSSAEADGRFDARIITNDSASEGGNLLQVLKSELRECQLFDFAVAFVADSGLQTLLESLNLLRDRKNPGRFLTSTYLNFNSPYALRKLLEYPNIKVRVYQGNMHTKGYLFDKGDLSTVIIGSSNLTQSALTCNKEWSVMFHSYGNGRMLQSVNHEFEELWASDDTVELTEEWLLEYEKHYVQLSESRKHEKPFKSQSKPDETPGQHIVPNAMQKSALQALSVLHGRGEDRALLISATGTGKTYLSALEIFERKPGRVLFVAHRNRILQASLKSFQTVLGDAYTYELYGAGSPKPTATCVFAMISTISGHLNEFDPREFDYIIIDEAHRVGAISYQTFMNYFVPGFYLGMTATPQRTDGYDVYQLFNHVIAYRITLQDALENEMLAPFHYFGIADLEIDDETIDNPGLFARLTSEERVKHVTQKIEQYTIDKAHRRGLIFCNRNDEAKSLSASFNALGYRTVALSGANTDEERDNAIARLEAGQLEYIFSVDILNEGIDIPSLNQIIMLRRTESPIVFVQQLGRGLRLANGKDYALILDFIGNYQKNYSIPMALAGDRTFVKDNLRKIVKEGSSFIPGCSTVTFDRVSEERVFEAIDCGRFSNKRLVRREYRSLRLILGRIPHLIEFDTNESIDPLLLLSCYDSYYAFLSSEEEDFTDRFSDEQANLLKFVSKKLASGKCVYEILIMGLLAENPRLSKSRFVESLAQVSTQEFSNAAFASAVRHLQGKFSSMPGVSLLELDGDGVVRSPSLDAMLESAAFASQLDQILAFALWRHRQSYARPYMDTRFTLNAKYTYEEVCLLLGWEKNINAQNIGGYKFDAATNTYPVFINYDKAPDISATIQYEDRFVSDNELIALSKQPRSLDSPEIVRLRNSDTNGMKTYLFVRKNKDDRDGGKEFYFLGQMRPTGEFKPVTVADTGRPAVEITYRLLTPVAPDLYDYITGSIN